MTEEAKRIADALIFCNEGAGCEGCPVFSKNRPCMNDLNAADLIERLSAELDAAKRDIYELCSDEDCVRYCNYCKYQESDGQCFHECKIFNPAFGWEWRGLRDQNGGVINVR